LSATLADTRERDEIFADSDPGDRFHMLVNITFPPDPADKLLGNL
tara:strand:+ start:597 stop:731 length:135 start_codon:yes stop_codon:yes gene_type:complete